VCFGEAARIARFGEALEDPWKLCLDHRRGALRLGVDHPLEPSERCQIADVGIGLTNDEKVVHPRESADVDESLGQIDGGRGLQSAAVRRKRKGALEQVRRGADVPALTGPPARDVEMFRGALRERSLDCTPELATVADRLLEMPSGDLV
jgi:hypothetical protein